MTRATKQPIKRIELNKRCCCSYVVSACKLFWQELFHQTKTPEWNLPTKKVLLFNCPADAKFTTLIEQGNFQPRWQFVPIRYLAYLRTHVECFTLHCMFYCHYLCRYTYFFTLCIHICVFHFAFLLFSQAEHPFWFATCNLLGQTVVPCLLSTTTGCREKMAALYTQQEHNIHHCVKDIWEDSCNA